ncbi:MAG TPA: hypothetical protein DDX29_11135, partial [Clostridiales bacterium]|nr:hypothetical protein [Clostridiales bacterium]
ISERLKSFKAQHVNKNFKETGYVHPVYLSILRSRAYTKVWKETWGEPLSIRKAKAFAHYLDTMPIFIRPEELLVGFYAEDPYALPVQIEAMDPTKGIDQYIEAGLVKEDQIDEWHEYQKFWTDHGIYKMLVSRLTPKERELAQADHTFMEVLPTQYTSRAQPEHELYLQNRGLSGRLDDLQKKLTKLTEELEMCEGGTEAIELNDKINDLTAMKIAVEAVIKWAKRYSALAKKMAEEEKDTTRKQELEQIAENCAHVPENEPRTFWEALQSHLFTSLAYQIIEHLSHGTSTRLDQIFWKFYEDDVFTNKTLPRDRAVELMGEFLLHIDEWGRPLPLIWRKSLQGNNFLATYTIGGQTKDGKDACNDLTVAILDAIDLLRINHPDFKFRWHPKVDPRAYKRAIEVIKSGLGQPSIKNDNVVIDTLIGHYGFTLEEARTWAVVGCISPSPTIHWGRCRRDAWTVYPAKFLELALFNGENPTTGKNIGLKVGDSRNFQSFEELFEAYRKEFAWGMRTSARIKTIAEDCNNQILKRPFISTLFYRSLNASRDIVDTPEKGMPWVNDPGIVDSVDSLISLKKLVFDDKKYTMDEVLTALKANWEGYEKMRDDFINAPKFGNNDDYADEVARQTYSMVAEEMSKVKDINNTSPMPSGLIITWMFSTADKVGALTNGRKLGDWLTDGGISPHGGYDKNGPMAAILSAAKIDARKQKANIFNQKLSASCIEGENGTKKLQDYTTTAMNLDLDMIQFNVVDAKTLKDAQKHPEKYPDLVVRVSGYNAHFIEMDKFVQDAVIERTEHLLV